jgi:NRPS condensation-like uncharacterized protein
MQREVPQLASKKTTGRRESTGRETAARKTNKAPGEEDGRPRTPSKAEIQVVTLRVPKDVYEAMRTHAFATNTTINDMATRALYNYLIDEGRDEQVDAFLEKAREQYRGALDKLAGRSP